MALDLYSLKISAEKAELINEAVDAIDAATQAMQEILPLLPAAEANANIATTKASEASTSASSALSYLTDFKGRYFGGLASNPTTDLNGNALSDGDLYFNTISKAFRAYDVATTSWTQIAVNVYSKSDIDAGTVVLNGIKNVDGSGSGLDADLLDGHDSTYFLPATGVAVNADKLDDIDSTGFVRSYKSNVTLQDNSTYTTVATVNGSNLGSAIRLAISGTTSNVVINVVADILVGLNHDIFVKSMSGNYVQCYIKIISNGNDAFDIQLKANSAVNNIPTSLEIVPLNGESVTFTSTLSYSTTTHEHLTCQGINVSSTDNTRLMYLNGSKVLDSADSSASPIANTIALRTAEGDIETRLFKSTLPEQTTAPATTADICFRNNNSSDNYMRFMSSDAFKTYCNNIGVGDGIGVNQTFQNETANRVSGTTYTNTYGKPIFIIIFGYYGGLANGSDILIYVDGVVVNHVACSAYGQLTAIIPPNSTYKATIDNNISNLSWFELK